MSSLLMLYFVVGLAVMAVTAIVVLSRKAVSAKRRSHPPVLRRPRSRG